METQSNFQFAALVKDQYLPPPLQANYLSLFDIQVKTAKQLLEGTQQQKIKLIKKRIKKFFDYGEDPNELQNQKCRLYPPFQTVQQDIKTNLEINSNIIILYGKLLKQIPLKGIQEKFPKPISCQRIDDCNMIITYANQKEGILKLYEQVKSKNQDSTHNLFYPVEIQWFQLIPYFDFDDGDQKILYARFGTNKEDILRNNDIYFRKILAKARNMFEKKKIQAQENEKQLQEKFIVNKLKFQKRKFIHRNFHKRHRNYTDNRNNRFQDFLYKNRGKFCYLQLVGKKSLKNQSSTQSIQSFSFQSEKGKNGLNETFFNQQPLNFPPLFSSNFKSVVTKQTYFQDLNFSAIKPNQMQVEMNDDCNNLKQYKFYQKQQNRRKFDSRQKINFREFQNRQFERFYNDRNKIQDYRQNHKSRQKFYNNVQKNYNIDNQQEIEFYPKRKTFNQDKKIQSNINKIQTSKKDPRQKLIQQYRIKYNDKQLQQYNYFRTLQAQRKRLQNQAKNSNNFIQLENND